MVKQISGEQHLARLKAQPSQPLQKLLPLIIGGGLVLVIIGFFGGVQYQKGHQPPASPAANQTAGGFSAQGGFSGRRGGFNGQRPTLGAVTAVSASSITVQDQSGSSKTLAVDSSTVVTNNGQTGTVSDIQVGDTVAVIANSSDTTKASRILLNPSFGGAGASGGNSSTSSPSTPPTSTE